MDDVALELVKLGFGEKKAELYLALLRQGGGSAAQLAEAAGIKRTTAYELLEELCEENLASFTSVGNRRHFIAEAPDGLDLRLKRQQQVLDRIMPELVQLGQVNKRMMRVRYFEGVSGSIFVHDEVLRKTRKEYYYFGSMATFRATTTPEYRKEYVAKRIAKGIWSNALLLNDGYAEEYPELLPGQKNLRRVRYLESSENLSIANTILFEGLIAVYALPQDNYSMIINSENLYNLLMLLWKALWKVSPESVGDCRQKKI